MEPTSIEKRKPFDHLVIRDRAQVENTLKAIERGGVDTMHIVADFDATMSKAHVEIAGVPRKVESSIRLLREEPADFGMSEEYAERAWGFHAQFGHIERDPRIDPETRKKAMINWWKGATDLLVEYGVTRETLQRLSRYELVQLRDGMPELLATATQRDVPVVILSAGLGDVIDFYFDDHAEEMGIQRDRIHVISNHFTFNDAGVATGLRGPLLHSLNKNEATMSSLPDAAAIAARPNILLFGDAPHDILMAQRSKNAALLTVGFGNVEDIVAKNGAGAAREHITRLAHLYDVVEPSGASMQRVNTLLHPLLK